MLVCNVTVGSDLAYSWSIWMGLEIMREEQRKVCRQLFIYRHGRTILGIDVVIRSPGTGYGSGAVAPCGLSLFSGYQCERGLAWLAQCGPRHNMIGTPRFLAGLTYTSEVDEVGNVR